MGSAKRSPIPAQSPPAASAEQETQLRASHWHRRCGWLHGMRVREVVQLLRAEGWRHVRRTGSHQHFTHPSRPGLVTVAGEDGRTVPTGTLRSIYRQAGLRWKRKSSAPFPRSARTARSD